MKLKFKFDIQQVRRVLTFILIFIKKSPEKVITGFMLAAFLLLGPCLLLSRSKGDAFSLGRKTARGGELLSVSEEDMRVDFGDLLTIKPIDAYDEIISGNPFSKVPVIIKASGGGSVIVLVGLNCSGIIYTNDGWVAFIEGQEQTYIARAGDELEGHKIISIDETGVQLYNMKKSKKLILSVGGLPQESVTEEKENNQDKRENGSLDEKKISEAEDIDMLEEKSRSEE